MKQHLAPSTLELAIQKALARYAGSWYAWIDSFACPLSVKEIALLHIYMRTGSCSICAKRLKIPLTKVYSDLQRLVAQLALLYDEFRAWEAFHKIEQQAIYEYVSERDRFLDAPIFTLPLSRHLKLRLQLLGEQTLWDVLKRYSESNLVNDWGIGDKAIQELKKALNKRGLSEMLTTNDCPTFDSS